MKETMLMAAALAGTLALACIIQPIEERLIRERVEATSGVKGEVPGAASIRAEQVERSKSTDDESERNDAC